MFEQISESRVTPYHVLYVDYNAVVDFKQ